MRFFISFHSAILTSAGALMVLVAALGSGTHPVRAESPQVSQHDVLPMLLLRCAGCHGRQNQEAGLDLRTRASMLAGGKSGPAFVPGKPEDSLILKRIVAEEMPPRRRLLEVSVKPMESTEVELLRAWIEAGAPEVAEAPGSANLESSMTAEDRQFWAFQKPGDHPVPRVHNADRVRNPIDSFILEKLEEQGLGISPDAERRTLLRRAAFNLTGLPPEPEDVDAYLADTKSGAYERMVDGLLSSLRYGERWGGHWLDAAGYADTEGQREQDILRPHAYRYRDYVIRSFNDDKPYDRFLLEQLAGDELVDYENAGEVTQEIADNLVATGFLRMVPDPTWANITGFVPNRLDVVADAIDVFASTILGLTIKCARCHDHKFDPISQEDYSAFTAVLKGAYDEHDWLKPNRRNTVDTVAGKHSFRYLPHVTSKELREWEAREQELTARITTVKDAVNTKAEPLRGKYFEARLAELPESIREDVRKAVETAADERDDVERYLAGKFEKTVSPGDADLRAFDEDFRKTAEEADAQIKTLEKTRHPRPMIRALWDRGEPSPTYLLLRGNYLTRGRLIEPAALSVLTADKPLEFKPPWPGAKKTGRRLALARWLIEPDHPLTARVMVNKIWKHHFRHGLVKSQGNFGHTGTPPTHPELLDWLAREFVSRGWSIKAMHQLIMSSSTYRQASVVTHEHEKLDAENDLLSRFPLKRMEAEVLWDTLLLVSGRLDETPFGPADGINVRRDGLVTAVGNEKGWRRSIYVQHNRKQNMTILECFDLPRPTPNCLERKVSTVAPQALHLLNNERIHDLSCELAGRVMRDAGVEPARQIDRLYQVALGRPPTEEERRLALATLKSLEKEWSEAEDSAPAVRALEDLCHVVINTAEFMYID